MGVYVPHNPSLTDCVGKL